MDRLYYKEQQHVLVKGATGHYKLRRKFLDRGREYSISIPYKG